jgi:hypothetical protein
MDFLPHLIPGTLLSRINATLMAVRCKTMNSYDFLWRVLELCVPGFDPVVAIQTPQWADCNDIFLFAQAYLLYFHLQDKMHYHYTDWTRSGIFLTSYTTTGLRQYGYHPAVACEFVPRGIRYGIPPAPSLTARLG